MLARIQIITSALVMLGLAAGCAPAGPATLATAAHGQLSVKLLYPSPGTKIEMGQALRTIIEVNDAEGRPVEGAKVGVGVADASGRVVAVQWAEYGDGEVYRSPAWTIPHRSQAGTWTLRVNASDGAGHGEVEASFEVKESVSEVLLRKYGFWVEAPRLNGIDPMLMKEQGDAQNGVIIWGGLKPMQHIYLENWIEVQWRKGDFQITSGEQARAFMLGQIGNFGIYPVREVGQFQPVQFKQWQAWLAPGRGQLAQYDEQWMMFYAPEVDKTYVLGTMVALPPPGIDPHATLRDGFEVHPEIRANGQAPEALAALLAEPELVSPAPGTRFFGGEPGIVLRWKPMKTLAADEYYLVQVDYNYSESNTVVKYTTRKTELPLPAMLYDEPNCGVFNWQVTLMRQTGVAKDGQPEGKPLSYSSLYWYVEWLRPAGERTPFTPKCQNPQT